MTDEVRQYLKERISTYSKVCKFIEISEITERKDIHCFEILVIDKHDQYFKVSVHLCKSQYKCLSFESNRSIHIAEINRFEYIINNLNDKLGYKNE